MADALPLAGGIDEQHRQMPAFLQLDHTDDVAVLLGDQDVVVTLQALGEGIGCGHLGERCHALCAERRRHGFAESSHADRADRGQVVGAGGADGMHAVFLP